MSSRLELARELARVPIQKPYNRFPFIAGEVTGTRQNCPTHYCQTMAIELNELLVSKGISARICLAEKAGPQQSRWHPVNVYSDADEWYALDPSLGVLNPQKVDANSAFQVGSGNESYNAVLDTAGKWIDISRWGPLDIRDHNFPGDTYTQLWQRDPDGMITTWLRFVHPSKSIPEGSWRCAYEYNLYKYDGSLPPTAGPVFQALCTSTGIDPASLTHQLWALHENRHKITPMQQQAREGRALVL